MKMREFLWQKAQELAVVHSASLWISAAPLRTEFSDLQHHSCGNGLSNAGRNSVKSRKGKAWPAQLERLWGTGRNPHPGHANGNIAFSRVIPLPVYEQTLKQKRNHDVMADWELFWQSKQGLNLELFQGKNKSRSNFSARGGGRRGGLWARLWSMTDDLAMTPAQQLCDPPKAVSPSK